MTLMSMINLVFRYHVLVCEFSIRKRGGGLIMEWYCLGKGIESIQISLVSCSHMCMHAMCLQIYTQNSKASYSNSTTHKAFDSSVFYFPQGPLCDTHTH